MYSKKKTWYKKPEKTAEQKQAILHAAIMASRIQLSTEQNLIVDWFKLGIGNLVVKAFAGAAKTFTIVAGLNAATVSEMAYFVFNKKNQLEAQDKITNSLVTVSTLHSAGFRFVRMNWARVMANSYTEFERAQSLLPADAPKQICFLIAKLVAYLKNSSCGLPTLEEAINVAALRDIDAGTANADKGYNTEKICTLAIESMKLAMQYPVNGKISFDDMVWLPVVMGWIKPLYNLVVIDEAQDMSLPQLTMAIGCCRVGGRICLVGDNFQAIYGFRGAMSGSLDVFGAKLNAQFLTLSTTYRCPVAVVKLAQDFVPGIIAADNAADGEVSNVAADNLHKIAVPRDVVLSRTNAPLMKACLTFLRNHVSAYIEGKDIGKTLIQIVENLEAKDMVEFTAKLEAWQAARIAKAGTNWTAANTIAIVNDQTETLRVLSESCLSVVDVIAKIETLFQDADGVKIPSVVCSTVHKSKGLEWDNVFLLEDTFASNRAITPEAAQEEKNIRYVAITRSKKKLFLVS